jgi:hypothetical protein
MTQSIDQVPQRPAAPQGAPAAHVGAMSLARFAPDPHVVRRWGAAVALVTLPLLSVAQPVPEPASGAASSAQPRVEWAIAPEGSRLPEGTVVEEGMVLPPGTLLPGGAVLPPTPTTADRPAPAPTASETVAPPAMPPALLPGESRAGVPHISGGVGASERERLEQVKSRYNLRLLFAESGSGSYLSNIRVQIQDVAGPTLLSTVTIGPWFYADLAPGDYLLTVEDAGRVQTRQVRIPASGAVDESFYWPVQ